MIVSKPMNNPLKEAQHIHFIGIGGIGISAVARMLLLQGKKVSGSDRGESEVTSELTKAGATISIGQKAENIPADCDLIIYTVAIPADNPEFAEAKKRSLPMLTYPETLRIISAEKYTIAVSGTHGKTTTTAMTASIMIEAGLQPTVLVGSLMTNPYHPAERVNFIAGESDYFIVEADEYKKSFHNLSPKIMVINNLDLDHLDFYKDLADIQDAFRELALRVPHDGYVIADCTNKNVKPVLEGLQCQIIDSSQFKNFAYKLAVPGVHNRANAASALAVASTLNIDGGICQRALQGFKGTWRRFEYKGETAQGALVYDDYAHNPQKVMAALQGAREQFPDKHIIAVFQPHLYSRTKLLFNDFAQAFKDVDEVLLAPIYAAREVNDPSITSDMLAEAIVKNGTNAKAYPDFDSIVRQLQSASLNEKNIIITMGAGDVYVVGDKMVGVGEE